MMTNTFARLIDSVIEYRRDKIGPKFEYYHRETGKTVDSTDLIVERGVVFSVKYHGLDGIGAFDKYKRPDLDARIVMRSEPVYRLKPKAVAPPKPQLMIQAIKAGQVIGQWKSIAAAGRALNIKAGAISNVLDVSNRRCQGYYFVRIMTNV